MYIIFYGQLLNKKYFFLIILYESTKIDINNFWIDENKMTF